MDSVSAGEGDGTAPHETALRTEVALDGGSADIGRARDLAAAFLTEVRAGHRVPVPQRVMDLTQLMVSELVTNSRKYAPGPILMDLRIAGDAVEVAVWDSNSVLPVARAADAGRVGQHGLEIVMAVAQSFEARREPVGKRITVRIALADDSDSTDIGPSPH
ncbi:MULTISPECIES: ATP-binding protein [Streptomyces]|uniref:ATP-binding protein n=1 Tax=Streptomyces rochei TaxID=1928 RepID=A0AAX3ZQF9_STRRO|nr:MULTISPECIES: ATP-binding protein [Streptomyces]WDI23154.1 ATP-binding protein [Streptomyces enissocaesilis]MBQ0881598.1 ATP-binding protein [Streptomyces sp. RT42]MDI3098264.1 ATP-binding protein [Streptomyces sp. AN-3]QCR50372.1 ATP-binding protein [Streptomyces sp. SGAir0924]RSS13297.1 ATP-binding protein [Streptomyces sp. WAC05458]